MAATTATTATTPALATATPSVSSTRAEDGARSVNDLQEAATPAQILEATAATATLAQIEPTASRTAPASGSNSQAVAVVAPSVKTPQRVFLPVQNVGANNETGGSGDDDTFDSPELRALKAIKWKSGRELTAYIQDVALQQGKRAMVATSGGSFKKFVCSSETPCPWLINAVCTRPRARKKTSSLADATDETGDRSEPGLESDADTAKRKYWYISSAYLLHTNCTGMAKPTARQLKDVGVLKQAVQQDAKISSATLVEQLKSEARLLCSKSMVYKAKTDLLDELDVEDTNATSSSLTSSAAVTDARQLHGFSMDVVQSTQRLPSYLARLSALNPDVLHAVERDPVSSAHLWRAIVALDPRRFFSNSTPLVFGVDFQLGQPTMSATTSRSVVGACTTGTSAQLFLMGCDANLGTITYATALVPEPSELHFTWFLAKLIDCGYPIQRANAVFTDGRWPVSSACGRMGVQRMIQDMRYLIEDLSVSIRRQLMGFQQQQSQFQQEPSFSLDADQEACIWAAQRAETDGEFYTALQKLELSNANAIATHTASHLPLPATGMLAAQQLRSVDPRRWALFPHHSVSRLYGWQTTRLPSQSVNATPAMGVLAADNGGANGMRFSCEVFKKFAGLLQNESFQRHEQATQWEREQRVVSPEAERMMQEEMKQVPLYEVVINAPHIAIVWNPRDAQSLQRRVDVQQKSCTCNMRLQFGVPCRHILSVLRKMNALSQSFDFFDDCYRVQAFARAHKGHHIELPLDETVQVDPTWLPPRHLMATSAIAMAPPSGLGPLEPGIIMAPLGEPVAPEVSAATARVRKRRVRNRPTEERKRAMYKCRKCNIADGHNSMTCPNKRSKA